MLSLFVRTACLTLKYLWFSSFRGSNSDSWVFLANGLSEKDPSPWRRFASAITAARPAQQHPAYSISTVSFTMSSKPVTTFWRLAGMSYLQVRYELNYNAQQSKSMPTSLSTMHYKADENSHGLCLSSPMSVALDSFDYYG